MKSIISFYLVKTAFLFLSLGLSLVLFLTFPPQSKAFETYIEGPVLFSDNFTDNSLQNWTIKEGNFVAEKSELVATSSIFGQHGLISTNSGWDNIRLEFDLNNLNGIDDGVGFRSTGSNFYELILRHGSGEYGTPQIALVKDQDEHSTTFFVISNFPLGHNIKYHIKIEAVDEHIQIWINNNLLIDVIDTGTRVKSGQIYFSYLTGAYGTINTHFDNIKVTSLFKNHYPVIFIPGMGGSELKTNQDIFWSKDDGHGGTFSHGYPSNEKVWVNQDEAIKLGDDDYFDILKLKSDGITPEADLGLTGNLTPFAYPNIDSFFQNIGYFKDINYYVFPYDWRKDLKTTQADLESLIDQAKLKSGQPKVNIVTHSLGGLVARNYISDQKNAKNVNKLIELGVPHLGTVNGLKNIMYGSPLGQPILGVFNIGIPSSETKNVIQNFPSIFELSPSKKYYDFYNNSGPDLPYPFVDERDIDNNKEAGPLSYNQTKNLLNNKFYNMTIFYLAEQFHDLIDPLLSQPKDLKLYEIIGSNQPTLGQIKETWWITWPFDLFPKTDELFINGDGEVPLYSASLKNEFADLTAGATEYYVDQTHGDLMTNDGTAMQTVKSILDEADPPAKAKPDKIKLKGKQVSIDNGNLDLYDDKGNHAGLNDKGQVENNIPDVTFVDTGITKHAFVKENAFSIIQAKATAKNPVTNPNPKPVSKTIDIKLRNYTDDKVNQTTVYKNIPATTNTPPIDITLNITQTISPNIKVEDKDYPPTSLVDGDQASDLTAPSLNIGLSGDKDSFGNFNGPVAVTITATDSGSGLLKTEYSQDNGETIKIYSSPFLVTRGETTTVQAIAIDKAGNQNSQSTTITINSRDLSPSPTITPTPSPTPTSTPNLTPTPTPNPTSTPTATPQLAATQSPFPTNTPIPSIFIRPTINYPNLLPSSSLISPVVESPMPSPSIQPSIFPNLKPAILGEKTVANPKFNFPEDKTDFFKYLNYLWILIPILESIFFIWLTVRTLKKSPAQMNYPKPEKNIKKINYKFWSST